jgi:hypothetical protein
MKRTLVTILLLVLASICWGSAFAQVAQPFVAGGLNLNGGGMVAVGGAAVGGIGLSLSHLYLDPEVGYVTGGKSNDNDNTSSAGHTRYAKADGLVKIRSWYVGTGCEWQKLYTPDYNKSSVHPRLTIGRDFHEGYVDRVFISYVQRGTDLSNGVNGLEAQGYWFFPHHLFLRMTLNVDIGHETIIPVSQGGSVQSVASELSQKITSSSFAAVMGWRF